MHRLARQCERVRCNFLVGVGNYIIADEREFRSSPPKPTGIVIMITIMMIIIITAGGNERGLAIVHDFSGSHNNHAIMTISIL